MNTQTAYAASSRSSIQFPALPQRLRTVWGALAQVLAMTHVVGDAGHVSERQMQRLHRIAQEF